MDVRIGNDIRVNFIMDGISDVNAENIKDVNCYFINTDVCCRKHPDKPFPQYYIPTEYETHCCGKPGYYAFPYKKYEMTVAPHGSGFCHSCCSSFVDSLLEGKYKYNHTEIEHKFEVSASSSNVQVTVVFKADDQKHCGKHDIIFQFATDNNHTYAFSFINPFTLVEDLAEYETPIIDLLVVADSAVRIPTDISFGAWTIGNIGGVENPIPYGGGTFNLSATASRTKTQNYSDGSTEELPDETAPVTSFSVVSGSATIEGNQLTVGESEDGQKIKVRATYESATKDQEFTQQAKPIPYEYASLLSSKISEIVTVNSLTSPNQLTRQHFKDAEVPFISVTGNTTNITMLGDRLVCFYPKAKTFSAIDALGNPFTPKFKNESESKVKMDIYYISTNTEVTLKKI